ncbi:flagellar filament capping protein FliD [Acidithiobacillus caldus]|uniref:Flagellar hook-associated protein 2 n=1 Tax=Acidithiobacillus caldus (strain ATCC 51756 / DSM 8584 / KU) TaxID=637389 RepID=A0A059ZW38_ACICK|nr:flagellar filament capping protein FliD [Acidithiobacillus caldus]AIA55770.1 Flagellar hook-associated protein FliD [Acidithiobacillus caldus ATCC 51756]MBU2729971.1 flagellar filament capping protein FliD [Acidithiobacillus caldus]MBU2734205.1 flagellar filament capping protein FliD [Acidithiobacillus caldus ATCC 51756]MBU2746052.1 flagellar filament capping protein FliD [Acidithiobacillus caldus]MBU2779940.1 flagellar filament capping protein FliD [Acidithiobacillus caldus]
MSISGVLSSSQIQSLVKAAENQYNAPIATLQAEAKPLETEISAYGNLSSVLGGLQSAVQGLMDLSSLTQVQANVGNSAILSATASNAAPTGSYSVTVSGLATAQSLYSSDYSSQTSAIGTGTLSIQVGNGAAVNIDVTSSNDTLDGLANAINQSGAGVTASVVYDGTGYRLTVIGNQTGSGNAFSISTTGSALSGFSYASGASGMTESQAAQNATASVNGISLTSASNTFSGAIPGVSFTVSATGSTSISVGVSTSDAQSAIQDFVQAFNKASSFIQSATAYTPASGTAAVSATGTVASGTAGPLIGDPVVQGIENQLLSIISTATAIGSGGAADAIGFGNIGITLTSSGTITVDQSALNSALSSNYAQVMGLFGAMGGSNNPSVQFSGATSGTVAGVYDVNVTANSSSLTSGTVNGYVASGSNGMMTVTSGPAAGMTLSIGTGTLPSASVFFNQGIASSMASLLDGVLGSNGVIQQAQNDLQSQLTNMNSQITQYQQASKEQISAMVSAFGNYENVSAQASTTANDLNAIFSSLFGGSSSGS